MSDELTSALVSLFVVALVAALAPFIVALVPRLRVPQVVVLIVGGIIIGPQVMHLAEPKSIELLSNVGLGFIFLLAGYELELALFRQRPGKLAIVAWVASAVIAGVVVSLLAVMGLVRAFVPVALGLTTTALGTLLPILRDNNMLPASRHRSTDSQRLGAHIGAPGSVRSPSWWAHRVSAALVRSLSEHQTCRPSSHRTSRDRRCRCTRSLL